MAAQRQPEKEPRRFGPLPDRLPTYDRRTVAELSLSAEVMLRAVLALYAVWTLFLGCVLLFSGSLGSAIIVGSPRNDNAERLFGFYLLLFVPVYLILAYDLRRYAWLMWVPFATLIGTIVILIFNMVWGDQSVTSGILPLLAALIFLALLGGVYYLRHQERPLRVETGEEEKPRPTGTVTRLEERGRPGTPSGGAAQGAGAAEDTRVPPSVPPAAGEEPQAPGIQPPPFIVREEPSRSPGTEEREPGIEPPPFIVRREPGGSPETSGGERSGEASGETKREGRSHRGRERPKRTPPPEEGGKH